MDLISIHLIQLIDFINLKQMQWNDVLLRSNFEPKLINLVRQIWYAVLWSHCRSQAQGLYLVEILRASLSWNWIIQHLLLERLPSYLRQHANKQLCHMHYQALLFISYKMVRLQDFQNFPVLYLPLILIFQ